MLRPSRSPGALIESPVILAALALWALNDHFFKRSFGGWWTGKLSDVCCLIVIPVILSAGAELLLRRERYARAHRLLAAAAAAAALIMISINVWQPAADAYEWGLGALQWPFRALAALATGDAIPGHAHVKLWMDASDSWTAPAALVPVWLNRRRLNEDDDKVPANDTARP